MAEADDESLCLVGTIRGFLVVLQCVPAHLHAEVGVRQEEEGSCRRPSSLRGRPDPAAGLTSQVRAYDLLRMLGRDGHPSALGQAFAEYGRIAKTLHLLAFVDPADEAYRRIVHRQLTIQESRHRLARKIFHGQRGELRQAYREGQEDQLGALGLVLNAVVLWNTRYTEAALTHLRAGGHVDDADAARLSPLVDAHVNMLGRYAFTPPPGTGPRPLRDPAAPAEEN